MGKKLSVASARSVLATTVWLAAVLAAFVLALSALCVALKLNQDNDIIRGVLDVADRIDLGVLKRFKGSDVAESSAATRFALVNHGVPAVIYLMVGKVLDRLIRP